ncbi:MAG: TetR/AcrR family transcriptional regulator [Arenicellales bacterium]|jgi:AcrR family transcriptional regulator
MTETIQETQKIRAEILVAAQERFRNFGYGKTTMAEIASDVNMSAANLYRYFDNKQEIAAECASQCMGDLNTLLENVVSLPNLDATQRLHLYVQTAMRYHFAMMHEAPRLNELVENITTNHTYLIHQKNQQMEKQIASILQQAVNACEFEVDNIDRTASAILRSTVFFTVPLFMHLYTLEEFEKMAVDVVTLIINGVRKTN